MGFFNLLADLPITFLGQTFDISLNWIGRLINALIGGIGIVGVGIIVFSLILTWYELRESRGDGA